MEQIKNIFRSLEVHSPLFPVRWSHHGEGLTGTGLTVREDSGVGSCEGCMNKGAHALQVDVFIDVIFIKNVIEGECVFFKVLGEVDLIFYFFDDYRLVSPFVNDVPVIALELSRAQRPLAHHHADLRNIFKLLHLGVHFLLHSI